MTSKPEYFYDNLMGHAQAVRVGDRIELAGQGGWRRDSTFSGDLIEQIEQAFANVEASLALAGAGWSDVVSVVSYHLNLASTRDLVNTTMATKMRERAGRRLPAWTCLGVEALGDEGMLVEIRVTAAAV